MTIENERDVIIAWKQGSKRAYETLVRQYMRDAWVVAYGFVGNAEDARDLSQEAFVKAYQARDRFDPDRPFYPWLYRIIKNHCLNFIKRGMKSTTPLYYDDNPDREKFAGTQVTPLEELEQDERIRMVRAAVNMLSENHREIILLKNFRGHSYQEIAEILDIPIGTVMSRLYYARRALKGIIERLEVEGLPEANPLIGEGSPTPGEVY